MRSYFFEWLSGFRPPPYTALAHFAGNLATCVEAGVSLDQGAARALKSLESTALADKVPHVQQSLNNGEPLGTAMSVMEGRIPDFFGAMITAGEQSGKLDDALRYLERHCLLLTGPSRAAQRTWLLPAAILVAGSITTAAILVVASGFTTALRYILAAGYNYGLLVAIVLFARTPYARPSVDRLLLMTPLIGPVVRDLAMNRFFHCLSMLYAAGAHRVEEMLQVSAKAAGNRALIEDLQRVIGKIVASASIPEAFRAGKYFTRTELDWIDAGDLAGTLEKSFDRIAEDAGERATLRLVCFQQISIRITMALVVLSIASTIAMALSV